MKQIFTFAFYGLYAILTVWIVVGGIRSLFTRKCSIFVGTQVLEFSGVKAIWAGLILIVIGLALLTFAYSEFEAIASRWTVPSPGK